MQESPLQYQLDLTKQIVQASQVLANRLYPGLDSIPATELEGRIGEFHIKNPHFGIIELSVKEQDVSGILNGLAQKIYDLQCGFQIKSDLSFNKRGNQRLHYIWEFKPSDNLEGLEFNIRSPLGLDGDTELLESVMIHSSPNLNSLYLVGPEDLISGRNEYHDENILLGMVENDPIQSLAVAYWLLEGLSKAEEIDKTED